ncbi:GntR family transcriptional regulator [Carnobacterium sp.]|uniref:GntR family transcriptional regulator n=1 Tax=Carnobacterium sp. TaxID=48221 RepID=UPI003C75318F
MFIHIKPESDSPIYIQLIYQIKKGIITKQLVPGEILPSVRSLAGDIGVNMHTVNKAYKQLEYEGIVLNRKNGFEVKKIEDIKIEESKIKELHSKLTELMIDAAIFQLTDQKVKELKESIRTEILEG